MDVRCRRQRTGLNALIFAALLLLPHATQAQNTQPPNLPDPIEIPDCRVSLITRATLAGERAGVLESIQVHEGETVEAGELIAQLRDAVPRAALEAADREARNDIDLRYARKASELATLEYSKALELIRDVPGSHSELDILRLKLAAERSVLQVEQAAHQLEMARLRREEARIALDAYRIKAPHDGIVLQVLKRAGEALHTGEGVVVIANFDRMRVEGFLPVADSWKVRPGAPVQVTIDLPGRSGNEARARVEGIVTFIDPVINEISQEVRIWAEVENRQHLLRDGMKGTMLIQTSSPAVSFGQ